MVQRMRAAQEALESEAKEEEFYLKALITKVRVGGGQGGLECTKIQHVKVYGGGGLGCKGAARLRSTASPGPPLAWLPTLRVDAAL